MPFSTYRGFYLADDKGAHLVDTIGGEIGRTAAIRAARRLQHNVRLMRAYGGRFPERCVFTAHPLERAE